MALTFNGATRTITWSGGPLSVREMWSRYVDWLAEGDNSKHGSMLYTVGMDKDDIPLYVFLEPGVTIVVTNNTVITTVYDGVLKTADDSDPFGGAVVNVRYQAPGIAIGYSTSGTNGPSAADIAAAVRADLAAELAQLTKVSKIHGVGVPLVVTPTTRTAGDLVQSITTVGDTTTVSAV